MGRVAFNETKDETCFKLALECFKPRTQGWQLSSLPVDHIVPLFCTLANGGTTELPRHIAVHIFIYIMQDTWKYLSSILYSLSSELKCCTGKCFSGTVSSTPVLTVLSKWPEARMQDALNLQTGFSLLADHKWQQLSTERGLLRCTHSMATNEQKWQQIIGLFLTKISWYSQISWVYYTH